MKKRHILISFISFAIAILPFVANAQNDITIHIVNESGAPIAEAVVSTLDANKNYILQTGVPDSSGYMKLKSVDFTKEKLRIMAFGYKDQEIHEYTADEVQITLSPLNVQLDEVVINAAPIITQKSDRIVFALSNENMTKGNSSFDLMKLTPLVQVRPDDKLSIIGKNSVQLYINGKKSNLPETAIQSYLKSLPANKIASIEIITNPGTTIRSENNQGIINLNLKKNEADGLNGTVFFTDRQKKRNSMEGGLYLNYQKNKLNMSVNLYAANDYGSDKTTQEFSYLLSGNHQTLYNKEKTNGIELAGMVNMDYNLTEKQTIGMVFNTSYNKYKNRNSGETLFRKENLANTDSTLLSNYIQDDPRQNYAFNLNYRLKIGDKGHFSIDLDYIRSLRNESVMASYFRESMDYPPYQDIKQESDAKMNGYMGKIEYRHDFNSMHSLTVGTEAYYNQWNTDFFYGDMKNGSYMSDSTKSNLYIYKETYSGTYASYSANWSEKLNSRIGTRIEFVKSEGLSKTSSVDVERNFFNVSPEVSLLYRFNSYHQLAYNFAVEVHRPGYYSMNPFRFFLTPTTYKEYNPDTKPGTFYINSLDYNLRGHYVFSLAHMYIKDCTNNFLIPDGDYTKYKNINYGTNESLTASFSWNDSFWDNRIFINSAVYGRYMKCKGDAESIHIDTKGFYYYAFLNFGIQLSKRYDWVAECDASYYSKMKLAQENNSDDFRFGLSLRKKFANDISLQIKAQNLLFKLNKRDQATETYKYETNWTEVDFRMFSIGVTIPFGNMKAKGGTYRESSSNVTRRLKE